MIIALSCSNSTVKIKQSFLFEAILFSSVLGNVTEMYSTIFWARTWEAIFFFPQLLVYPAFSCQQFTWKLLNIKSANLAWTSEE